MPILFLCEPLVEAAAPKSLWEIPPAPSRLVPRIVGTPVRSVSYLTDAHSVVITNEVSGNFVVAADMSKNGTLVNFDHTTKETF